MYFETTFSRFNSALAVVEKGTGLRGKRPSEKERLIKVTPWKKDETFMRRKGLSEKPN